MKKKKLIVAALLSLMVCFGQNRVEAQVNLPNGLLVHLLMDGTGQDVSGNNNHATVSTLGAYPTQNRFNTSFKAMRFNGATENGSLNFNASLLNNRAAFSMSYWFMPSELVNGMSLVGQDNILETGFYTGPNRVVVYHPTSTSVNVNLTGGINVWQHLVVTGDNTEMKIYLNGLLVNTIAGNFTTGNNTFFTEIAGNVVNHANNTWFRGRIDDVRIYNRVLNQDEVDVLSSNNPVAITINSVNGSTFCAGASLTVNFTVVGDIFTGNEYQLQLSSPTGSFANPVIIDRFLSTSLTGTFNTVVPKGTPSGTAYQLRVVSTNMAANGSASSNLTINGVLGDIPNPAMFRYVGHVNGKDFYKSLNTQTWANARTACLNNGGRLAVIPDETTNDLLYAHTGTARVYIGLNDQQTEGVYVWENNEPLTYINWSNNEPNNSGNEDFGEIRDDNGKWNDINGTTAREYFLELSATGLNLSVCPGANINLSGTALSGASYSWTGPNGFTSSQQNPVINNASAVHSGVYTLTYTSGSCSGSQNVVVSVTPLANNLGQNSTLPTSLTTGLVLYYPMNGNATDASGNGLNGTLQGGVTPAVDRFGDANNALSFNGSNGYVNVPAGVYFNGGDFTVSAWVRKSANNNFSRLFDFGNGQANNNVLLAISSGTSGRPISQIFQNTTGGAQVSSPVTPLTNNQWELLTYTWSNNAAVLYINGVMMGQGVQSAPLNVVRNICYIGRSNWAGDGYAQGRFDDFRIYNRILTESEINALVLEQPGVLSATVMPNNLCSGSTTQIVLYNTQIGVSYQLKNAGTSANVGAAQTGNGDSLVFNTGVLASTTDFNFEVTVNVAGCISILTPNITVTMLPLPTAPVTNGASVCNQGSMTITASGATGSGFYNWYTVPTGGTPLVGVTGNSHTTAIINATENYYVSITDDNGCESARTIVSATVINPLNPPVDIISNLLLYYKFDGNLADSSGNAYNATINGANSYVNDRNGNPTSAINSTATGAPGNNYMSAGNPAKIQQLTNQVTISMWIRQTQTWFGSSGTNGFMPLVNKWDGGTGMYIGLNMTNPSNMSNRVRWRINGTTWINSNTDVPVGQWHHIVCTYDGANLRIFQNGVQTAITPQTGNIPNTAVSLMLGRQAGGGVDITYRGDWDQVRIYNRALNLSEVQTLHNNESVAFSNQPLCDGEDNLALTTFNFPGATYQWSGPNGFTSNVQNPPVIMNADSATYSGLYTLQVTAQGCTSPPQNVNVNIYQIPLVPLTTNDTVCGSGNATLLASGAPSGASYLWYTVPVGGTPISGQTSSSLTITGVSTTIVRYVSIIRNGCEGPRSEVVAVYYNNVLTGLTTAGSTICENETTATVTVNGTQTGVNYQAFFGSNPVSSIVAGGGNIIITVNTSTMSVGNNTVVIKATQPGCGSVDLVNSATIAINALPSVNISANGPLSFCTGGTVELTATAATSYLWSTGAITQSINVSNTGSFSVTITNSNGCSNTSSVVNTVENSLPVPVISAGGVTTFCSGGNVTLNASGGSTYLWSTGSTSNSINATTSGTYNFTAFNGSCSAVSGNIVVTVHNLPSANISANGPLSFCNGGSVELTASAANSWLWSNGATTQNITVNSSGNFAVTLTDANGCSNTSSTVSVNVDPLPVPVISASGSTTICAGESVTLFASGGTSYLWSTGSTSSSILVSTAGTYHFEAFNGACSATSTSINVVVNSAPAVVANASQTTVCSGEMVTLSGSGAISYSWNNGVSDGVAFTALNTTTYQVTGTGVNGCTAVDQITVTVNPLPNASFVSDYTSFCPGITMMNLTANQSTYPDYDWYESGNAIHLDGPSTITISNPGNYELVVTDNNGCTNNFNLVIGTGFAPSVSISSSGTAFCVGESEVITASLESGAFYTWYMNGSPVSGPILEDITFNASSAGNYFVEITNASGCTGSSNTITMTTSPGPNAVINSNGTLICAGDSVFIFASSVTGASYQWTLNGSNISGAIGQNYYASVAGNYAVIITDGCSSTSNTITISPAATVGNAGSISGSSNFCAGESGIFSITPVANATNYNWSISPVGTASISSGQGTTSVTVNSTNQNFTLTVTPQNNCGNGSSSNRSVTVSTGFPCNTEVMFAANITNVCLGNQVTYTNYTDPGLFMGLTPSWNFGAGASPATATGNGPHVVTYSTTGLKTVTLDYVDAFNNSFANETKTNYVNVSGSVTTSAISGNTTILCSSANETYSVTATAGSTYNWTVPGGAVITGGQGSNSITVNMNGVSGTISVVETNTGGCSGNSVSLTVTVSNSVNTSSINGPLTVACASVNEFYSVTNTTGSIYNWTVPSGAIILSGQGTSSITINFNGNFGVVSVTETNSDGCNGSPVQITVNCNIGIEEINSLVVIVYPNPTNSFFAMEWESNNEQSQLYLYDAHGKLISNFVVVPLQAIDISTYPVGIYFGKLQVGDRYYHFRMIKN